MHETSLHFYHSKIKLFLQIIVFFPTMIFGYFIVYMGWTEQSLLVILLGLFIGVLFSFFWAAATLKLLRHRPYITITDTHIQLDSQTKSEITIYYDDIRSIQVTEASFQKLIEIAIYDEAAFFDELSLHNKIRLGPNGLIGLKKFMITYNAVRKSDRPQLLAALDNVMACKDRAIKDTTITDTGKESAHSQQRFMKKYDAEPLGGLVIDKDYFIKAYGYSFFFLCIYAHSILLSFGRRPKLFIFYRG